jgi:hypothetical protein
MDWVKLGHSGVDLTGVGGVLQDVTPEQLAAHSKKNDAWIAIRGKVKSMLAMWTLLQPVFNAPTCFWSACNVIVCICVTLQVCHAPMLKFLAHMFIYLQHAHDAPRTHF